MSAPHTPTRLLEPSAPAAAPPPPPRRPCTTAAFTPLRFTATRTTLTGWVRTAGTLKASLTGSAVGRLLAARWGALCKPGTRCYSAVALTHSLLPLPPSLFPRRSRLKCGLSPASTWAAWPPMAWWVAPWLACSGEGQRRKPVRAGVTTHGVAGACGTVNAVTRGEGGWRQRQSSGRPS